MKWVALALLICLTLLAPRLQAYEIEGVDRVVAVGDVHGAYTELHELLTGIGLVDEQDNWRGGTTHFVSLGDLLDRGPDSRKVMDLLMALQPQAQAAGGRVHVVLGNHELMNLTADTRDVSDAEYAAFGGVEQHATAFSPDGDYGRWLLSLPAAIRIGDSLFVHGGVSSVFTSVAAVNRSASENLAKVLRLGAQLTSDGVLPVGTPLLGGLEVELAETLSQEFLDAASDPVFGSDGPFWYRGNAACHAVIEEPRLQAYLARLGVRRVVIGHTPTPGREVVARLDDRVFAIDTGMLSSVYRGNPRALEIEGVNLRVLMPSGEAPIERASAEDAALRELLDDGAVVEVDEATVTLRLGVREQLVAVEDVSAKERKRAVAALRLDRKLELMLVPPLAEREIDGDRVLLRSGTRTMSERSRLERGLVRPTYCEADSDYDLVAAFDSLIGKTDRGLDGLGYDPRSWAIVLKDVSASFPSSARMPRYRTPPRLAPGLARRLGDLNEDTLRLLLGDLLKPREIKGILKRRERILGWPGQFQSP
jgi:hypothetical protein